MNKQFASNLLLVFAVNIVVKGVYLFGVDRTVQNTIGPVEYGWYFDVFNFCLLFQIILDFGFQNYNTRHVAQHPKLLRKYFPSVLAAKLIMSMLFVVIVVAVALLVFGSTGRPIEILLPVLSIQWLSSFLLFQRSNVAGLGLYRTDSLLSGLEKLLMILLVGLPLLFLDKFKLEYFLFGQIAALVLANLVLAFILRKRVRWKGAKKPVVAWVFKSSLVFALVTFLMIVYTRVDAVMLERMLPENVGPYQVGIYAAAYRLLDAISISGLLMTGLLLPMFSKQIVQRKPPAALAHMGFGMLWTIGTAIAGTSVWWATEIMGALYTDATTEYALVFMFLFPSFLAWSVVYIYGALLTADNKLWPMCKMFAICALLNVILNFVLIPKWMAFGSAISTLATQSLAALLLLGLVRKYQAESITSSLLLRSFSLLAFSVAGGWIIHTFAPFEWLIQWLITILASVLISFSLGLIRLSEWLSLLKK